MVKLDVFRLMLADVHVSFQYVFCAFMFISSWCFPLSLVVAVFTSDLIFVGLSWFFVVPFVFLVIALLRMWIHNCEVRILREAYLEAPRDSEDKRLLYKMLKSLEDA